MASSPGCFIAVVGPSGAGKDSLIDAARNRFGDEGPVRFVRRAITRPADAGGEDHDALTAEAFAARRAAGGFALSWSAHGLDYGIPADVAETLGEGRAVLANLSRGVLPQLRAGYPNRLILSVTAAPEVLAARLFRRGREGEAAIAARLRRAEADAPAGPDVAVIRNDGSLEAAAAAFIEAIRTRL
jgi:phosphonate metabolism protein PhnN/1,5-bisphosphokinase (PRPP-forming)